MNEHNFHSIFLSFMVCVLCASLVHYIITPV